MPSELLEKTNGRCLCILVDNDVRYDFFKTILLSYNPCNILFLHASYYTYRLSKQNALVGQHILLKRSSRKSNHCDIASRVSIQEYKGYIDRKTTMSIYSHTSLEKLIIEYKIANIWVFSGFQFSWYKLQETCSQNLLNKLNIIYFEIGNFPNKFQCGLGGVNADNISLRSVQSISYDIEEEDSQKLFNSIIKFQPKAPSRKLSLKITEMVYNKLGNILYKTLAPQASGINVILKLLKLKQAKKLIKKFNNIEIPYNRYAIFISQVSEDTQTIIQSTETEISALKKAYKISLNRNLKLIVRLHPREYNVVSLKNIVNWCELHDIIISNKGSLIEACSNSDVVITINSTGGCHMLLINKEVITLGDAFYKNWSSSDVVKYHNNFLLDIDE